MPCKFCQMGNCVDPSHAGLGAPGVLYRVLEFVPPNERGGLQLVNRAFRDAEEERLKDRIKMAREESARRMESTIGFGKGHGATLVCWIDQGNDVVLVKAKEFGKQNIQDGLCLALALEWIRAGLRGEMDDFRRELTKRITDRTIERRMGIVRGRTELNALEEEHAELKSESMMYNDLARDILDHNSDPLPRQLSQRVGRLLDLAEHYANRAEQKANEAVALTIRPYVEDMPLSGTGYEMKQLVKDGDCSTLVSQLFGYLMKPGYYLLSFNVPGAGHAVAFHVESTSSYTFFDANTGEWKFGSSSNLKSFFTGCWQQLYAARWGASGKFGLWRYGSKLPAQKKDDNCSIM